LHAPPSPALSRLSIRETLAEALYDEAVVILLGKT
jgi:hypothetical protein